MTVKISSLLPEKVFIEFENGKKYAFFSRQEMEPEEYTELTLLQHALTDAKTEVLELSEREHILEAYKGIDAALDKIISFIMPGIDEETLGTVLTGQKDALITHWAKIGTDTPNRNGRARAK